MVEGINEAATLSKKAVDLVLDNQRLSPVAQTSFCRPSFEQFHLRLSIEVSLDETLVMTNEMVISVPPGHKNRALVHTEVFE
ncbi:hypothetical protein ACHAPE_006714 [Trichoderma viride]